MVKRGQNEFGIFARQKPKLTVLTDQPPSDEQIIELFESDPFNFRYKLGPVYDIMRNPDTKTPAAILISGGWESMIEIFHVQFYERRLNSESCF